MEKKAYFSPTTINKKSEKMLEKIKKLGLSHSELTFVLQKAALLVLDVQKYFFSVNSHAYIPSAKAIIPNIQELIGTFSINKRPIFFTRHGNNNLTAGMMKVWWKELLEGDSEMSTLISEIDSQKSVVIKKEQYDAFWKTSLDELLKNDGVEQVVVCGVMTHLCCETTARSAFIRDYRVFFAVDGTATYTEELHMASLLTLSHGFAKPVLCKEIAKR